MHVPQAELCKGRHLDGRKYGILKIGRFWRIGACISERDGSLVQQLMQLKDEIATQ